MLSLPNQGSIDTYTMQTEEDPPPASTEVTTEAATTSTTTEPTTPSATFVRRGSSLLRDWNSGDDGSGEEDEANALSSPPPVDAPAVVLNETSEDSNAAPSRGVGVVPVATFVSNLVNELRSHIPVATTNNLSMRSEPAIGNAAMNGDLSAIRSFDVVTNEHLAAESLTEDFVLIDGDLVAIPSNHHAHSNGDDNNHCHQSEGRIQSTHQNYYDEITFDSHHYDDHRRNFRPNHSKMRRGVSGIKKWIKRKGRRTTKQQAREHFKQAQSNSQSSSRVDLDDTDDSAIIPVERYMESRKGKMGKKAKKKKKKEEMAAELHLLSNSRPSSSSIREASRKGTMALKRQKTKKKKKEAPLLHSESPQPPAGLTVPSVASSAAASLPRIPYTATAAARTITPPPLHVNTHHRAASIAAEASFVGNADQLMEAGVLPGTFVAEAYIEDRLDDYDKYDEDKKDPQYYPPSLVPKDADFKVDKQEAPCVESMLRRAGEFARDLEASVKESFLVQGVKKQFSQGKSDGGSVPLSMATSADPLVHNDILKIVMLGAPTVDKMGLARKLRRSKKKKAASRKRTNNLGVDVHSWTPTNEDNVKFTIWSVQGNGCDSTIDPYCSNFGAHPGTHSLFFSDRSLYLLVWDLAATNRKTYRREFSDDDSSDSDEEEDSFLESNDYLREEANRQADRALQTDIEERVLSWVDCIARRGSHSAVLPVALVPSDMSPHETKRRCDIMQRLLMDHTEKKVGGLHDLVPPKVLSGADTIHCVSLETQMGMDLLEETILAIATDISHSVFDHVGTHANNVPHGTLQVLETARKLKEADQKLVSLELLMSELPSEVILSVVDVMTVVEFLSCVGELIYFGGGFDASGAGVCDGNHVLSQYIILSSKWLVSALSCILRNDLKRELTETRRVMNVQGFFNNHEFPENHVVQSFSAGSSSCPLLSSSDTEMLWQSMSFMTEAADKSSQLSEHSTTSSTMFVFLETLLVHTGIFLPLDIVGNGKNVPDENVPDNVYFAPSLLAQAESNNIWTFKSSEAWTTTLCHSWLFRDGAPVGLMEHVTVALLRDLYEFSYVIASNATDSKLASNNPPSRAQTSPLGQSSVTEFMDIHDGEAIGRIKIHQINCWKSSLLVKIGCVFPEGNELRESFVEILVSIIDQSSPNCVASDAMRSNMERLVVSGKGNVGHHGRKIWKGGYGIILDSIKASVAHCTNVDRQVVCPECLAHTHPSSASTWSWDSVRAAAGSGSAEIRCMRGHRVDSNLICGNRKLAAPKTDVASHHPGDIPKKSVKDLLPSVVVVGLWDSQTNAIRNVGSGFIVDKKHGLVVTAGHILFSMNGGTDFGSPYLNLNNAKVVIGVIPSGEGDINSSQAVFRYFAEIVAEDIHNVDACVLKITTRMEQDVDSDALVGEQPEIFIDDNILNENLPALKLTRRYEIEETVRILGFNQGGEGLLEKGKHVNRTADFAKGYICKQFKMLSDDHSNSDDDSSSSESGFSPREEIVIMCPTISGHSGGPCVNDEGKVIGILSRADQVDRQRCYLAPTNELKSLVNKAKNKKILGGLKMY